jgi:hypothetical protein
MDGLGEAGSAYRSRVYHGFDGRRVLLPAPQVVALLDLAQRFVEAGLRANRRQDALYHSYNLLDLTESGAGIRRLPEMLEGQVAVLSSGLLDASESLALLQRLRTGPLYREDQHSYLLYPDKDLPGFLSRNRFDASQAASCPLVDQLAQHGDRTVVVQDIEGVYHFAGSIHNARDVEAALDRLSTDPRWYEAVERDRPGLFAIFEAVFRHAEFTGRSGSFFAYEGLGSIYWHMVAKLLLAIQETLDRAAADGATGSTIEALIRVYRDVQAGLGYRKSPGVYGAFPTDPYSHTPAGGGARQPGMTGQVKEEVLLRLRELGLGVEDGCIMVRPTALFGDEWTVDVSPFRYRDVNQQVRSIDLPAGSFAFTFGQVPVVYRRAERFDVIAHLADGSAVICPQGRLDAELSASVFRRQGVVTVLTADIPARPDDRGRPREGL